MAEGQISRRQFLRGLGAAGVCALCGGAALGRLESAASPPLAVAAASTRPSDLPSPGREAMFYTSFSESALNCGECHRLEAPRVLYCHSGHGRDFVKCQLCPRQCLISDGRRGECGVRENRGGTLHSVAYGNVCAVNVDPIEKKPFYHFLPGATAFSIATAGCNLHCLYCQNWSISQVRPEEVENHALTPEEAARAAKRYGSRVMAYTYTEPTVYYEYVLDVAWQARLNGLRNVVISAGYINPEPLRLLCRSVDAVKIDLKGFHEDFYREVCDGSLQPVLDTLKTIHACGTHLEIVSLVVPTLNDDVAELSALSRWVVQELGPDVPLHFSRFHPEYRLNTLPSTPVETLEQAREAALQAGVRYAYVGNVPGHAGNHTYCPGCGKIVVERQGYTVTAFRIMEGRCGFCGEPIAGVWA